MSNIPSQRSTAHVRALNLAADVLVSANQLRGLSANVEDYSGQAFETLANVNRPLVEWLLSALQRGLHPPTIGAATSGLRIIHRDRSRIGVLPSTPDDEGSEVAGISPTLDDDGIDDDIRATIAEWYGETE